MSAQTEADQYGAFVRRIVRAYRRRIADRDIEGLTGLATLQADVDQAVTEAVRDLLAQDYSWADIGKALGMTRQGAQQKYGKRIAQLAH